MKRTLRKGVLPITLCIMLVVGSPGVAIAQPLAVDESGIKFPAVGNINYITVVVGTQVSTIFEVDLREEPDGIYHIIIGSDPLDIQNCALSGYDQGTGQWNPSFSINCQGVQDGSLHLFSGVGGASKWWRLYFDVLTIDGTQGGNPLTGKVYTTDPNTPLFTSQGTINLIVPTIWLPNIRK